MIDLNGQGAQQIIIGSAMTYGATESTMNAISRLSDEMFTLPLMRYAFKAIKFYVDRGDNFQCMDIDDKATRLMAQDGVSPFDNQFMILLETEKSTTVMDTRGQVNHLIACYQARTLQQKLSEAQESIISGQDAPTVMRELESVLGAIDDRTEAHTTSSVDELIDTYVDHIESKMGSMGLRTGFVDCDKLIGRVHPGNLIIIGGRSGQGKTEFSCAWALDAVQRQGLNVLYFSLEMGKQELMDRFVAINLKKPVEFLDDPAKWIEDEMGGQWALVGNAAARLRGSMLHIHAEPSVTLAKMRSVMKKVEMKTKRKLDAVFIDYLQILGFSGKRSRYEEMCDISVGLKNLAKDFGLPVIALAQLNRESAKTNREPKNHDIKDCGQIEQDADKIMFVYRDTDTEENKFLAKIIFGKMRQGRTGAAVLTFQDGHFYDLVGNQQFVDPEELARQKAAQEAANQRSNYQGGYRPK